MDNIFNYSTTILTLCNIKYSEKNDFRTPFLSGKKFGLNSVPTAFLVPIQSFFTIYSIRFLLELNERKFRISAGQYDKIYICTFFKLVYGVECIIVYMYTTYRSVIALAEFGQHA